jgi:M6 family metalloprotease-like protein
VETVVVDAPAHRASRVERRLRANDGTLLALDLPRGGAEPESGAEVTVRGVRVGDRVAAGSVRVSPLARTTAPSCAPTGQQDVAVLLVTIGGTPAPELSAADAYDLFFGATSSVDSWVREASYGKAWLAGGVFGWYTVATSDPGAGYEALRDAAIAAADRDVDFRRYSRVFVVISGASGCTWTGIGSMSCATLSSPRDGSFTASSSWMVAPAAGDRVAAVALAAHELGHNFGLGHAATRDFGSAPLGALGAKGTIDEYGDPFSAMGASSPGHYAAPHKAALGWLAASNVASVESGASFVLSPLEIVTGGVQALKVRRGTGNDAWLWLTYRQPVGADANLGGAPFAGALVHYQDAYSGLQTQLVDFSPATGTFADPPLPGGAAWADPYSNLSVSIGRATANGLEVTVSYGAPKCVPAAPAITLAPPSQSVVAGGQASYTLTVTNQDSAACPSSTFSLGATLPAALAGSLSPSTVSLAPGSSASAVLTVTAGATSAPSALGLTVTASGGSAPSSASAAASCTVVSASLDAVLTVPALTFARGDLVPLSVTSTFSGSPAPGASVVFTITKPNGAKTSSNATANADGKAAWSYRIVKGDPRGTYAVSAVVSYGGRSATPAAAAFQVQ